MREAVVLVHGIWTNGLEFWRMRRQLRAAGYDCYIFPYHAWSGSPGEIAERLQTFVTAIEADKIHFIGHSYGGILLLHLYDRYPYDRKGRAVLVSSPVNGSIVASRLYRLPLLRGLLGGSVEQGVLGGAPVWRGWQEIGVIAGTVPVGLGLLLGGPAFPHDGMVSVAETQLKGATDFITVPATHTMILMSGETIYQVITFLRAGQFDSDTVTPILDTT